MDAISDELISEVVVMKAAQVGWTEILNNAIGYYIHQLPAPVLLMQPDLNMADAWSKDRFAPMLRDTPVLVGLVADPKARDSGNTILHKKFHGGHLTVVGSNSPSSLASRPIRVLLCDEVDRYPSSAGTEGDPIDLARRRTATFRNRKILMGSTPTIKGSSRIETAFEQSDQRYYFVPCPHCDEFQRLMWAQVKWDEGQPDTAAYVCQHCGSLLTDADKQEMLLRGEWRASRHSAGIAGFHLNGLYTPWATWAEMAKEHLRAKRLPETLQTWINTFLGETWEDKGETVDPVGVLARRESYTANSLPPGVLLVTVGTDTQDDRLESTVWGWGADEEAWRIEHLVFRGDPGKVGAGSVWADHDDLLKRRFATDDGRSLGIEACCVDSGGHFTEQVYRYCHARKRQRVWAIKGAGGQGRLVWPRRPGRGQKVKVDVWLIGVDTVKDVLYGRMRKVLEPGPGYVHFDATTDEMWVEQLTSETVVYRMSMGRKTRLWRPRSTGVKQEALDCAVYAYAAMIGRGGMTVLEHRSSGGQYAGAVPKPVEPVPPVPTQAEAFKRRPNYGPIPKPSWVKGWRS